VGAGVAAGGVDDGVAPVGAGVPAGEPVGVAVWLGDGVPERVGLGDRVGVAVRDGRVVRVGAGVYAGEGGAAGVAWGDAGFPVDPVVWVVTAVTGRTRIQSASTARNSPTRTRVEVRGRENTGRAVTGRSPSPGRCRARPTR
jgi:hypothetical protein